MPRPIKSRTKTLAAALLTVLLLGACSSSENAGDEARRAAEGAVGDEARRAADAAREDARRAADAAAEEARRAADAAREDARRAADGATSDPVRNRVCEAAADGQVSDAEAAALRVAVPAAEAAGVSREIIDAVRGVIGSAGGASREAVQRLRDACAR